LDQRIREFKERGRFSDLDQEFLTKAQDRVDRLRTCVAEAEKHATAWDLLKAEAERDFAALAEDVERLARRSAAEFMKHRASDESEPDGLERVGREPMGGGLPNSQAGIVFCVSMNAIPIARREAGG
jgi:hypothetical protein